MRFRSPTRTDRSEPRPRQGAFRARREKDRARALYLAGLCIAVFDGAHLFYRAEDVGDWVTGRVLLAVNAEPEPARNGPAPVPEIENVDTSKTDDRAIT
jgi:hypothetical protein